MVQQRPLHPTGSAFRAMVARGGGAAAWVLLCAHLTAPSAPVCASAGASPSRGPLRPILVDSMTDARKWRLGGDGVAARPGRSTLSVTRREPPEGLTASLELVADFADPERRWVSACGNLPPVTGRCRSLALQVWSDGSGAPLKITVEDAAGTWFERDLGALDGAGWRSVAISATDTAQWRALVREGETGEPMRFPVAVRRLSVGRPAARGEPRPPGSDAGTVTCRFADLRAETEVDDLDLVQARIHGDRAGRVFLSGETPEIAATLTNRSGRELRLVCEATVTPFAARPMNLSLGSVALAPGGSRTVRVRGESGRYGPHEVAISLRKGERVRHWRTDYAFLRSSEVPGRAAPSGSVRPEVLSRFGANGNAGGFAPGAREAVAGLNRGAGIGWCRVGLAWAQVNPAPGVWAWDPPSAVPGPMGAAAGVRGRVYRAKHTPALDCPDEVTVAFWARLDGPSGARQIAVRKWGSADARNYGAYFRRDTGAFCFSAGYARKPGAVVEFTAASGAWDGRWRHYAATYSRHIRSVCLYVDGALQTSAAHDGGKLRTTDTDLIVGDGLAGDLDDILVYRRALGPADVAALARKAPPPRDGMVARYAFDGPGAMGRNSATPTGMPELVPDEPDAVRIARQARVEGMMTLAILGFPPAWASAEPGSDDFWRHEPDLKAWSAYVEAVVRRYGDRIGHWEIWNEPNSAEFWAPRPDPARYLAVLKVAYAAAKRANPRCTVIMPGLASQGPGPDAFMDRLLELGAARHCDAISLHPWAGGSPERTGLARSIGRIARLCAQHGTARPIWVTELGWSTEIPGGLTERDQAAMLARSAILTVGSGAVERLFWFRLHDSGPDRMDPDDNFGLCREDLSPKPAYFAHRTVAVLLGDSRPSGSVTLGATVQAKLFRSAKETLAAIWRPEGSETVALNVGQAPVTVTDLMGNSRAARTHAGVLLIRADDLPVFVRGVPGRLTGVADLVTVQPPLRPDTLRVRVRNPYPMPVAVQLKAEARGAVAELAAATQAVPARGAATVAVRLRYPPRDQGKDGALVTIHATYPGGIATRSVPVSRPSPAAPGIRPANRSSRGQTDRRNHPHA